jgi:hypothetical protein
MKTMMVALAIAVVATATARPAFARKYDDFELKELRDQRAERKEEKAVIDEERAEEMKKANAHAHAALQPAKRKNQATEDGGGSDPDAN